MGCSGVAIKESVNPSSSVEASPKGGVSESVQKVRREFGVLLLPPFGSINEMFLDFLLFFVSS